MCCTSLLNLRTSGRIDTDNSKKFIIKGRYIFQPFFGEFFRLSSWSSVAYRDFVKGRGYHLWGDPVGGLGDCLRSRLLSCLGGWLGGHLGSGLGDNLGSDLRSELGSGLGGWIEGNLRDYLGGRLLDYG